MAHFMSIFLKQKAQIYLGGWTTELRHQIRDRVKRNSVLEWYSLAKYFTHVYYIIYL